MTALNADTDNDEAATRAWRWVLWLGTAVLVLITILFRDEGEVIRPGRLILLVASTAVALTPRS